MVISPKTCGGTFVASKYIVTVAHCFFYDHDNDTNEDFQIPVEEIKVREKLAVKKNT